MKIDIYLAGSVIRIKKINHNLSVPDILLKSALLHHLKIYSFVLVTISDYNMIDDLWIDALLI